MNLLMFVPVKIRPAVELVADAVPVLKCVLEGHQPLPLVAGKRVARNDEGVKQIRLCQRCKFTYWEEPS